MNFKEWLDEERISLRNDFYSYPRRKILFLILGVFVLVFSIFRLWLVVSFERIVYWDNLIVNGISNLRRPFLDIFFHYSTHLGSAYFIAVLFLILVFFLFRKRMKRAAAAVFLTLLGSALFIFAFKDIFGRSRPFGCFSDRDCFSFPSGHVTISFYFYTMLFYLLTRFIRLKKITVCLIGLVLFFLIVLVAFSRIYLGYHFLTDVMGGFLLGGVFLLLAAILVDFLYQKK